MAFRLVPSVSRSGSANSYFVQRIPADVRGRAEGLSLLVPIGPELVRCNITAKTTTIRLSLRTADASQRKVRQAEIAAYFETLWHSLRSSKPISLTHRQCVALAGDMYRSWANAEGGRTTAVEFDSTKPGAKARVVQEPFEPPAAWQAALRRLPDASAVVDPLEELEPLFGSHADHALRDRGIAAVEEASRAMILLEFLKALHSAWTVRERQAGGDYSPPPESTRFPEWEETRAREAVAPEGVSLRGLVDRWWVEGKRAGLPEGLPDVREPLGG